MASDSAAASRRADPVQRLPDFLEAINEAEPDDRPEPCLGQGDEDGAEALVHATRLMLAATTPEDVVAAVATFAVQIGAELVPAAADLGGAVSLDIALGTGAPVLADAAALSVTRMRLEQYLPGLLEDARLTAMRLRHISDLEEVASCDPATGLLTHREVVSQGADLGVGHAVCLVHLDFSGMDDDPTHRSRDDMIRSVGRAIADAVCASDSIGRVGDDQIIVLQRDVRADVAAERLRDLQTPKQALSCELVPFSAGVAAIGSQGWDAACADASAAMDVASSLGDNCTSVHGVGGS